jgi:hypothetical protein
MEFSKSILTLILFPVLNLASVNICSYTVPPSVFWFSSLSTSLGIIIKYLTYFSCTIHFINVSNSIQPTYSNRWPITVAERSKGRVCGRALAEIVVSNLANGMDVCLLWCCVLSGRGLCDGPITRPEDSY